MKMVQGRLFYLRSDPSSNGNFDRADAGAQNWRWRSGKIIQKSERGRTDHIKSEDKLSSFIVNKQEEENRSDLGHGNWQTHILATCVSSHSNIPANWPAICWLTLEISYTYAQNATNHSVKLYIWRLTCSFTAGRSHTNVLNATKHSDLLDIWRLTCSETQWGKDASLSRLTQ